VAAQRILVVEDEAPIRHLCSFGHTQIRGDGIDLFVVHNDVVALISRFRGIPQCM
jgi:hypothetical protein